MYKFGGHILCDKCKKILATHFNFTTMIPSWEIVKKKSNGTRDLKRGIYKRMDFCNEKCRTIFFRGRKYWARKLEHLRSNGCLD